MKKVNSRRQQRSYSCTLHSSQVFGRKSSSYMCTQRTYLTWLLLGSIQWVPPPLPSRRRPLLCSSSQLGTRDEVTETKKYKVLKNTFFNGMKVPASLVQQRTLGRQAPFILASNVFFKPFLLSSFSLLAYSPLLPWNAVCDGTEILTSRSFSPPSLVIRMNLNMKREIQFSNFILNWYYANIFNLLQIFCRYVCPVDILHQLWGLVKLASCTPVAGSHALPHAIQVVYTLEIHFSTWPGAGRTPRPCSPGLPSQRRAGPPPLGRRRRSPSKSTSRSGRPNRRGHHPLGLRQKWRRRRRSRVEPATRTWSADIRHRMVCDVSKMHYRWNGWLLIFLLIFFYIFCTFGLLWGPTLQV